jgi:hypothetical protein
VDLEKCPICKEGPADRVVSDGWITQTCGTCGRWKAREVLISELDQPDNAALLRCLAAHIRQANARGEEIVELTTDNWRDLAGQHAHTSINRKLDMLLRWFERQTTYAGEQVTVGGGLWPLIDAVNANEVAFLAEALAEEGLLRRRHDKSLDFHITASGFGLLSPLAGSGKPGTCFIAMSFDPSLDVAFRDGIVAAVEKDCGYFVDRVDRVPHNENISDRIIAGIRGAQFVVADFTMHRQAVYYEAGFAQGLGRDVIRTCRDTAFNDLNFDTRQFLHLKWSEPSDLRITLANHVLATIGRWK